MPGLVPGIRLFRSLEAKSRCPALHRSAVTVCCPKWRPHREEWARDGLVGDASVMERAARLAFLPLSIVVLEEKRKASEYDVRFRQACWRRRSKTD
jgi:hypothetical protein